ncbi:MAG: hypothetical protein QOC80_1843, partial [Frankiaceae bacterium]|nr:hypothetical protein [Frankiaceae bacterium]
EPLSSGAVAYVDAARELASRATPTHLTHPTLTRP